MTASRTIPTSQTPDLVSYTILIDGTELPVSIPIKTIVIQREVNKIPFARLSIIDGDPAIQDFLISNQDHFVPGKDVEIKLGYRNDDTTVFKGIITGHSNRIMPRSSELLIECRDKSVKLTIGKKSRHLSEMTDSDIAEEIIDSYGLEKDVESTTTQHENVVQYHTSDWDFMLSRLDRIGRLCLVEDGKIIIKKPELSADAILDITYGATILNFSAEIDARNQYQEVVAGSWDYSEQEVLEETADEPEVQPVGNLSPDDLAEVAGPDNYRMVQSGKMNSEYLKEWADAKMLRSRLAKITGTVRFQGTPVVMPGMVIEIHGVGERFNGPVFVKSIRHECADGNWTTTVQFGMSDSWFTESIYPDNISSSLGIMPSVQGLQIGKVIEITDPLGENRIRVQIPAISSEEDGIWMRIATLDAGPSRGTFFMPEIDDEVVVGFIHNDPSNPVVLGMLHSTPNPAPFSVSEANPEKGFVSRSGVRIVVNDDDKSCTIETPAGKKLIMDDNAGSIQLNDEMGNKITMNTTGIAMESALDIQLKATANIKLEAVNIMVSPSAQFSVGVGGSQMSVGAGSASLKSAKVKIEGTGMTDITGGMVKIN